MRSEDQNFALFNQINNLHREIETLEVANSKMRSKVEQFKNQGKYSSEGAAREWSTVVDISITPLSFKLVPLSLPRSPLSKTPKQVFFNPINIF